MSGTLQHFVTCYVCAILKRCRRLLCIVVVVWLLWFIAGKLGRWRVNRDLAAMPLECWSHYATGLRTCRPLCPRGEFSVGGTNACRPWLTCEDFRHFKVLRQIGEGAVKRVYLVDWRGTRLAHSVLMRADYAPDFAHGLAMLQQLQPTFDIAAARPMESAGAVDDDDDNFRPPRRYVTQLAGACEDDAAAPSYATEYHPLGTAERAPALVANFAGSVGGGDAAVAALKLCLGYARLLEFMHGGNGVVGVSVMCDANDLPKLLSQLLLRDDLTLLANDLDATPLVTAAAGGVKCGRRELFGDFVAPEQLWPHGDSEPFDDARMPAYTEKVDVYKAPDVCAHFLSAAPEASRLPLAYRLFAVHRRCKSPRPEARPTATELRRAYERSLAAVPAAASARGAIESLL